MRRIRHGMSHKRRRIRQADGRFKRATLADMNMTVCPDCRRIVPIIYDQADGGFIDPRSARPDCDHTDASGRLMVEDTDKRKDDR